MAFTHVMVGATDPAKGKAFYDATLGALGWPAGHEFRPGVIFYSHDGAAFGVGKPADGEAATHANGGTIGFAAQTKEQVDAFHAAGLANGGTCAGEPGKRPGAPGNAYGAYLRDPTGNKICTFCQLPADA
ncbi:VOC family protein [Sphingobium nicotianae]|nr:VOC family protein [Sphingobium nicotianae]